MAIDSDDSIALPSPPPPRPAARKAAIETALRKFDGIEEPAAGRAARKRPSGQWWATMHRRPAGALMAAALIAIIGIPAMQIALRDSASEVATESSESNLVQPVQEVADKAGPPSEAPQTNPADPPAFAPSETPGQPAAPPPTTVEDRASLAPAEGDRKVAREAPAPVIDAPAPAAMTAAPAPPPPPPPPPPPEPEAAGGENIVVTGSRVRRPNVGKQRGYADRVEESASSFAMIDPHGAFLSRLQAGLRSNDRRAIVRLIGFPLQVNFDGESRTYRTARDVNRDFDRIFTAGVRQSALALRPDTLMSRDGGKLKGGARLWFGCGERTCSPGETIRIKEVNP